MFNNYFKNIVENYIKIKDPIPNNYGIKDSISLISIVDINDYDMFILHLQSLAAGIREIVKISKKEYKFSQINIIYLPDEKRLELGIGRRPKSWDKKKKNNEKQS